MFNPFLPRQALPWRVISSGFRQGKITKWSVLAGLGVKVKEERWADKPS